MTYYVNVIDRFNNYDKVLNAHISNYVCITSFYTEYTGRTHKQNETGKNETFFACKNWKKVFPSKKAWKYWPLERGIVGTLNRKIKIFIQGTLRITFNQLFLKPVYGITTTTNIPIFQHLHNITLVRNMDMMK